MVGVVSASAGWLLGVVGGVFLARWGLNVDNRRGYYYAAKGI
jgi:hypothetical protein